MNIIKKIYRNFCSNYQILIISIVSILVLNILPTCLLFFTIRELVSMILHRKELYTLNFDEIIIALNLAMISIFSNYIMFMIFLHKFFDYVYFYKLVYRPLCKYPFKLACLRTGVPFDVALPETINGKSIEHYVSQPPIGTPLYKCRELAGKYLLTFIFIYFTISLSDFFIPDKVSFNITKYMIPKITNYQFCYAYAEKNYPDKINFKMAFAKDYDKCLLPDTKFQSQTFYSADNIKDFKKDSSNIFWTILKFSIAPLLILFLAFGKIFSKKKVN